jgi:integrase/recombinase XerD
MKTSACARFDIHLSRILRETLPEGTTLPCHTSQWPAENVLLLEEFIAWLVEGGAGAHATETVYLPAAGLILGLNLKPHAKINLHEDLQKALVFTRLRQVGPNKLKTTGHGLEKFKRFLRFKRGLGDIVRIRDYDLDLHARGLPDWLIKELQRYHNIMQKNWRAATLYSQTCNFWDKHLHVWKYLCFEQGVRQLADIKRRQITDLVAKDVREGRAASTINTHLLLWKGFLAFLRAEGYEVPQSLLLVKTIKQPETLPKYLPDGEMIKLRNLVEQDVREAHSHGEKRDALLLKAAFYLMWHAGLRLAETEELALEDLDLAGKRLTVRNGKGMKDRTVYLTGKVIQAIREYLEVRGPGSTSHLLLYNHAPVKNQLFRDRLKALGERAGLQVYPHRLRHSAATQLLNAGCRITSIQKILGHKRLDTTLRYARAYDETIAEEFYAAMERVEQRLAIEPVEGEEPQAEKDEVVNVQDKQQVLFWIERLAGDDISHNDRQIIATSLKQALFRDLPGVGLPAR